MVNIARELLRRQYTELTRGDNCSFSVGLEDDDLFKWRICFQGPYGTPFEGGIFTVILTFPDSFPNEPPQMKFEQKCGTQTSIQMEGDVYNDYESSDERWRPVLSVESIVLSVISMLSEPNIESPANVDAAVELKGIP